MAPTMEADGSVKPILLMLQGLPASGKTTYAKQQVDQGGWIRVNKDDLRSMLNNGQYSKTNEKRVIRIRDQIIIDGLANGKSVIVDDTNLAPYHQETLYGLAKQMNAEFKTLFFDTPLEDCIARNNARGNPVPNQAIVDMYTQYLKPEEAQGVADESITEDEEELPECIIVDIDGTLAHINDSNPRNVYDASRAMEDILDDAVANVVNMAYQNGYQIIVFTGRKRAHQSVTEAWLKTNGVNYDEIYTRKDGDNRKDFVIKKEMYQAFVEGKYKVKYVIDDRPSVCRMWRDELGLKVLQVGDPHHEF